MKNYDIAIIGNGIAAAAALITLNQCRQQNPNLAIALIAPNDSLQGPKHRVGESLPPSVKPLLQQLDIWPAFNQANFAISRNRYTAWETQTLQPNFAPQQTNGFGWCIDRAKFEQILWRQANNTPIERINGLCKHSLNIENKQNRDCWQITTETANKQQQINATFILDCTGRAATFAKHHAKREKCQAMVAICDFLAPQNNQVERTSGVMIEATENGWWYSTLLPSGYLAIAYFTLRHMLDNQLCKNINLWHKFIAQGNYTKQRISTGEFIGNNLPKVFDTTSSVLQQSHQQNWLACGDAAIALDPLSAHGMSTALWSGRKAALALVAKLAGNNYPIEEYVDSCISNWHLYHNQRADLYQASRNFNHSKFWQSFIQH